MHNHLETVTVNRDTDGFSATDCDSGDSFSEVNLVVMKQEPDDVCCVV